MHDSIYGDHREGLVLAMENLQEEIRAIRTDMRDSSGMDPVEHILGRIKSEESMREKCRRKGLEPTTENALFGRIHDAIGVRVVCAFIDDVYVMRDRIAALPAVEVVEEKDYIRNVKVNGYRSYHMIIRCMGYFAEIQIRTISMDTWAALEHHLKYKKNPGGNTALISSELKRCADELASTDVSLQAIRDMIQELE